MQGAAFAHAVHLHHGDVEAHEELQSVFADGGTTRAHDPAAVKSQHSMYLLEEQIVGKCEAPRRHILPATKKMKSSFHRGKAYNKKRAYYV